MMSPEQEKLIDECIEAHYNMIRHHRRQILELCRRKMTTIFAWSALILTLLLKAETISLRLKNEC